MLILVSFDILVEYSSELFTTLYNSHMTRGTKVRPNSIPSSRVSRDITRSNIPSRQLYHKKSLHVPRLKFTFMSCYDVIVITYVITIAMALSTLHAQFT